ncbi:hypothetical protein A6X20_11980 [Bradyrhizobium elkanii]|nr:hypothetical protein A6452_40055 [Bradyrhizobium elkanii]ODM85640.1 hypothetical protein A6X20_11980 [Bradyrhizobium elkanii]
MHLRKRDGGVAVGTADGARVSVSDLRLVHWPLEPLQLRPTITVQAIIRATMAIMALGIIGPGFITGPTRGGGIMARAFTADGAARSTQPGDHKRPERAFHFAGAADASSVAWRADLSQNSGAASPADVASPGD